jgi:hypothetical protein
VTDLVVVDGVIILRIVLGPYDPVAHAEAVLAVDEELHVALVRLVEPVVVVQHVVEERLAQLPGLHAVEASRIEDVRIVHIDYSGLLGERFLDRIEHIDESGFLEVRQIVDHRGAACLDALGQQADVGRARGFLRQDVEQLLEFGQIAEFDFLEEEHIHLEHGVHVLDEHLRVVLLLEEERIVTVVQIVLEVVEGLNLRADVGGYLGVVGQNLLVAVRAEVGASHEVNILTEGESTQVVAVADTVELGVGLLEAHHRATGEDDLNLGILLVDKLEFLTPVGVLEDFINQERPSSLLLEVRDELSQRVSEEVEMVHVDVKAPTVVRAVLLESILQEERSLAYTTASLDADQTATPVNLVYQTASDRAVDVFDQILVCSVKCLHFNRYI